MIFSSLIGRQLAQKSFNSQYILGSLFINPRRRIQDDQQENRVPGRLTKVPFSQFGNEYPL
jgi:hypothetical protein